MDILTLDALIIAVRGDIIEAAREFAKYSRTYDGHWYKAKKDLLEAVDKLHDLEAEWMILFGDGSEEPRGILYGKDLVEGDNGTED